MPSLFCQRVSAGAILILGLMICVLMSGAAAADPATPDFDALRRKIEERDRAITDLLRRMEALERAAGIKAGSQAPVPDTAAVLPPETGVGAQTAGQSAVPDGPPGESEATSATDVLAERALERTLVRSGALLLAPRTIEVEPSISYGRVETRRPVLATVNGVPTAVESVSDRDLVVLGLSARLGLPHELQLEAGISGAYAREDEKTLVGSAPASKTGDRALALGDLRLGVAKTLLHQDRWQPDLVGRVTWDSPLGRRVVNGIGFTGGYNELESELIAIRRQDPLVFLLSLGYSKAFRRDGIMPGDAWMIGGAAYLAVSAETSVRLGLSQTRYGAAELDGVKVPGSAHTEVMASVGFSSILSRRLLLDLSLNVGLTDDSPAFTFGLSTPLQAQLPAGAL